MQYLFNTKPLLCQEIVDRKDELQELREALQRAATGQPQLVLLAGEAGVGKTKLCRSFMEESKAQHILVLFGQAIPQDVALPFGPFLDAFRRYFTAIIGTSPPSASSLHTVFASLLRLFPELTPMFRGSLLPPLEPDGTTIQSKQVIFHGISSALQELAGSSSGPLLLILEDLHWADETSLELLAFLAQRLDVNAIPGTSAHVDKSVTVMILGTYRAEALSDAPALSRLLLQLHTQRHAYDIQVGPLTSTDHKHCVNSILRQTVPEEFTQFLYSWDEGNPFFTEELLGSMAATGHLQWKQHVWQIATDTRPHLPLSLTSAILERFERLPVGDQEVLSYAAVIGRVFDFSLLAALANMDERELVSVLRRAMSVQLISEVSYTQPSLSAWVAQERYQFRHALTREAIYGQMLAPERRLGHRAVAEMLEQLVNSTPSVNTSPATRRLDDVARLLAEHYWLADLPTKARPYALHEAERARRVFAFREERYYLNMVQTSLPADDPERLQMLQRMGMLSLGFYDFADALHWLTLAKNGYQRIGHHHQALQVMANLLFANWFLASQSMPDILAEIETAAELVFADPDPASRDAETLVAASILAHYWTVHSLYTRSALWIKRCFALFESLDDPRKVPAIQLTYITRGWFKAHGHNNDFEEGRAEIRHAIDLASQYSLPDVIMMGYAAFAWLLIYWGRADEAEQVLEEADELEERSGTLLPLFLLGWLRFFSGDQWELGMKRLRQGIEQLEQVHASYLVATGRVALAHLLLARNELDEAGMHLQAAQPALETNNEYVYLAPMWWGFAGLHAAQGNLLEAQEWYERILNRWKTAEDTFVILPILLDGIVFYADTGNLVKARQWLDELRTVMQRTDNPVGAAALLEAQGAVHAQEGKIEQAIQELRQAVEVWSKLKRDYQRALTSQRLAELLLTWARKCTTNRIACTAAREEANMLLDQALAVYKRLQIPTGIQAIQMLRSSTHLQAQWKRRQTLETHQPLQGLTQREMQVLLQLTAGRSNREIAAVLHISVGTVELHVTHILAKLGCETRTQAAAYAFAHGWVTK
ncbi:MAG: hypothetical protein NVS4B7_04730 [Ktedonobacteraceae bacterium]